MMIFNNDFDLGFNSVYLKKSEGSEIGLKKLQLGRFIFSATGVTASILSVLTTAY